MHSILSTVSVLCGVFLFGSLVSAKADSSKSLVLAPEQLLRIQRLTSVFENSSIEFDYSYVQNLHDGRGFTAGRAGFCTGTGDLLPVVEKYSELNPKNPLQKYIGELRRLNGVTGRASASVRRLRGFAKAWKESAKDKLFREIQDQEVSRVYLGPAIHEAEILRARLPFTAGLLFDTFIQHGPDKGPDGALTLIGETNQLVGLISEGTNEKSWDQAFMKVRAKHLLNAAAPATRREWRNSVGRVYAYEALASQNYWDFASPFTVVFYGQHFLIP